MKKQKCNHPQFYTMGNTVYCNPCHHLLGWFSPYKPPYGFIKGTDDDIKNEYLNKKIAQQ